MEHHGVLHFFIAGNIAIEMCSSMIICRIFTLFRIVPPHMRHPPLLAHGWGVKSSKELNQRVMLVPKLSGWKYSGGDSGGGHKRLEDNWPKPELGREACILGSLPFLQQSYKDPHQSRMFWCTQKRWNNEDHNIWHKTLGLSPVRRRHWGTVTGVDGPLLGIGKIIINLFFRLFAAIY